MIRAFFASRHWRLFAYGGGAALLIKPRKSDAWIEETDVDGFNLPYAVTPRLRRLRFVDLVVPVELLGVGLGVPGSR